MDLDDGVFVCIVIIALAWIGMHIAGYYPIMMSQYDNKRILKEIQSLDKPIIDSVSRSIEYAISLTENPGIQGDALEQSINKILLNISNIIHYHVMFLPNDQAAKDRHIQALDFLRKAMLIRLSKRTSTGLHSSGM